MLTFHSKGNFSKTLNYMSKIKDPSKLLHLDRFGQRGVKALQDASPRESGLLSASWGYEINKNRNSVEIIWTNKDIEGGCNVAILVQYGHATRGGTFVKGIDFVNPAMRPIFEEIADDIGKEIARL